MPRKKRDDYEEDSFLDEEIGELDDDFDDGPYDDDSADDDIVDEDDDEVEKEEKPARKPRRKPKAKAKDKPADEEQADNESGDDSAKDMSDEQAEAEPEVEEEIDYPPDDKKAVAALEKLHIRLDVSEKGNVWRAIFNDAAKDQALLLLAGLPALKELWLLGSKVTPDAAKSFKEEHPKMTVYN